MEKMKFIKGMRVVLLLTVVIASFVSCGSDDLNTGAKDVASALEEGIWRVGYFYDSGVDKTKDYEGYNFIFGDRSEGGILYVSKDPNVYTGTWLVNKNPNDADSFSTIFTISLGTPDLLASLSGEWKVVENTGSSLKLKNDSKGDTAVDYLNFEKQ